VRTGSFGMVPAQDATPLALVLTELVTNAVEHGFVGRTVGTVEIGVERENSDLRVVVADDGVGLPENGGAGGRGPGSGLGTQIVRTLVTNELGGTIEWSTREGGGTQVELQLVLRVADQARV
jgi:two-component sensor histidine kinase